MYSIHKCRAVLLKREGCPPLLGVKAHIEGGQEYTVVSRSTVDLTPAQHRVEQATFSREKSFLKFV
jgi:hypothetical protein